jgi:hypothetical protein
MTPDRMGRPFVDGDRVAVEWWTTMIDGDEEVTLLAVCSCGSATMVVSAICASIGCLRAVAGNRSRAGASKR